MRLFLLVVLLACAYASPQYVKSRYSSGVKGGYSGPTYQGGENLIRYFNNNTQPGYGGGYNSGHNMTPAMNYEKGVCYIEVPTASIARDPAHVPPGNGSRPDLSRIRSCCHGYIRNIHNYKICDPVCTNECVNALCTEPETCTCFPGHVKNLGGICVSTCPIGCQNGHCAGGECICREGFTLDSEGRFCVPVCRDNCGRMGNCTAPNTCECKTGYSSTSEGACRPHCDRCGRYAECVAPNVCQCQNGYMKNQQGDCVPQCADNCQPNGQCVAPNVCNYPTTSTTTTISPAGQNPQGNHYPQYPNGYPYAVGVPNYQGYNPNNQYPGNSQSNNPSHPQSNYPGNQQSNYPGNQQSYYPGNQPTNYPGQQSHYPDSRPDQSNQSDHQQPSYPGYQPSNYPAQRPNPQPIYYNPGQRPPTYSDSQHGYYDNQRTNQSESQQLNPSQQQPYPGYQQPYPGYQHYPSHYPQYPTQQQSNSPNQSYPYQQQNFQQQSQNQYSENQMGNVETLCTKPCINGECRERDLCVCNDGYVLDETDTTVNRCKPYCHGGCPNGVCSSPDFCICNMGYHKERGVKGGRATCVRRIRRSVIID